MLHGFRGLGLDYTAMAKNPKGVMSAMGRDIEGMVEFSLLADCYAARVRPGERSLLPERTIQYGVLEPLAWKTVLMCQNGRPPQPTLESVI
jgi:hypothetical protein